MIATVGERQAALAAAHSPWRPTTLHGLLDDAARTWPDRHFVVTDERRWTYAEMAAWSRRLAAGLIARGVAAGDRVAMLMANQPEFVALKFAIARAGAVAVPINIGNRRDELGYVLRQSGAVLLVATAQFRGLDQIAMILDLLDEAPPPTLQEVIAVGDSPATGAVAPFHTLIADAIALSPVDAARDCDILYTSGTTGAPKGVLLTHDMLTRTAFGSAYARAFEDGHRILFSLPMYHVFGYVEGLLAVPWVGGAIVPQLRFDAEATLRGVERHRATDLLLVPAMTLAVLETAAGHGYDLSSLHAALASGGRAPPRVWDGLRDGLGVAEITTGYGMTETTASTTVTRPDDPPERLLATNGRLRDVGPAADPTLGDRLVTYRVLDPATGADVPSGVAGELVARGLGVTRGYHDKPAETAQAFTTDGWLRTGDLGHIDADGYVTLVGRLKESYRCGGEQVLPGEVEALLVSYPDIAQAHVVPMPDERMGEVGVAFVVPGDGVVLREADVLARIGHGLARFKHPRHILFVNAADIPTTASGRARKFLLAEMAVAMLARA